MLNPAGETQHSRGWLNATSELASPKVVTVKCICKIIVGKRAVGVMQVQRAFCQASDYDKGSS